MENTLAEIRKGVKRSPGSVLVLNAEDTQSASLALDVPNKVVWYGLEQSVGEQGQTDLSTSEVSAVPSAATAVTLRMSLSPPLTRWARTEA